MTAAGPAQKLVRVGAIAIALLAFTHAGCVLDWTLREATDASPSDASSADAAVEAAATDAAVEAAVDANAPDAASCATLLAEAQSARAQARACTLGVGDCAAKVKDECGCDLFVARAGTTATTRYQAAVAAAVAAGCTASCGSCPFVPAVGTCLQSPSGIACSP